jgi:hypothetical protein
MQEDRRQLVLQALDQANEYNLNEQVIKIMLEHMGHRVGADIVRAEITWLEEHQLVRVERLPRVGGEVWIVTLSELGQSVARGRYYPGVRKPDAS